MTDLRIVSTYHPANWGAFVERNLLSWREHVDAEVVVYHEGEQPDLDAGICWREWNGIPGAVEFVEECRRFPAAQGKFGRNGYDYNYDAAKFSHKVYAQIDAAEEPGELLLWLDSDVEVVRPFSAALMEDLLLAMPLATYQRPGYHSETGVVAWDMRTEDAAAFFRAYRALYENRRIFCLPRGWHDCWALDFVVAQLGMPVANLTRGGRDYSSAHHQDLHVVPDSELGAYLRHDKGGRKRAA